jgi:SAM-dependent methyltransferase
MTTGEAPIIGLAPWLETPPGQYLLAWEQAQLDEAVADLFGFMPCRWGCPTWRRCGPTACPTAGWPAAPGPRIEAGSAHALCCEPEYLPFADQSLDLVVLPHTLERAADPHRSLAEVERVLRPEGRVVIVGLNPVSLWGLRQRGGGWRAGPGCGVSSPAICRRVRSGSATGGCGIGCAC